MSIEDPHMRHITILMVFCMAYHVIMKKRHFLEKKFETNHTKSYRIIQNYSESYDFNESSNFSCCNLCGIPMPISIC